MKRITLSQFSQNRFRDYVKFEYLRGDDTDEVENNNSVLNTYIVIAYYQFMNDTTTINDAFGYKELQTGTFKRHPLFIFEKGDMEINAHYFLEKLKEVVKELEENLNPNFY